MFLLYKIYCNNELSYIGRSKQKLQVRLYQHFHKAPMIRDIDINQVTKIEFTELQSEADMNVWEIYLINKYKPHLNKDSKSKDDLTFDLIEPEFKEFYYYKIQEWKDSINLKDQEFEKKKQEKIMLANVFKEQCKEKRETLSSEDYIKWRNDQEGSLNYKASKEIW